MRLTGAALLVLAGLLLGQAASDELRARTARRAGLRQMLERMAYELARFKTPLPALFRALGGELEGDAGALCRAMADGLESGERRPLEQLWAEWTAALPEPERSVLRPLGSVLGRYGAEEQLRALESARAAMERAEAEAREQLRQKGRMYIGVSAAGAAALAVLLL